MKRKIKSFLLLAPAVCVATCTVRAQALALTAADAPTPVTPAVGDIATPSATPEASALALSPANLEIPEAPLPQSTTNGAEQTGGRTTRTSPGQKLQPLSVGEKVRFGVRGIFTAKNLAGVLLASGYEQLTDGTPHYGTNSSAFGERLGAAALRGATQNVFTDMVYAPLLHQDPRYYVKGSRFTFLQRATYAATRVLVTRTDDGRSTVNSALLLGYASAAALTPVYYPARDRTFRNVALVWGGSLGGAALGFNVSEFSGDVRRSLHRKHAP